MATTNGGPGVVIQDRSHSEQSIGTDCGRHGIHSVSVSPASVVVPGLGLLFFFILSLHTLSSSSYSPNTTTSRRHHLVAIRHTHCHPPSQGLAWPRMSFALAAHLPGRRLITYYPLVSSMIISSYITNAHFYPCPKVPTPRTVVSRS